MNETSSTPTLNPWFTMWLWPKRTIRQIIETDPVRLTLLISAISGIGAFLARASFKSMGDHVSLNIILLCAIILGPIGGIIKLYFGGAILRWTGNWIGGKGTSVQIRAAIAWSSVITIWILPLWIPELIIFGPDMFTTETPRLDARPMLLLLLIGLSLFEIVVTLWGVVVFIIALSEVQGFSFWKALGNLLLAFLVIVVPFLAIGVLAAVIMK